MGSLTPPSVDTQLDPSFYSMQQQAVGDYQTALQQQLTGDTASIMARFGSRVAMANAAPSPVGVR